MTYKRICIIGSSGAIGQALIHQLLESETLECLVAISRSGKGLQEDRVVVGTLDFQSEESITKAAEFASAHRPFDLILIATGILHKEDIAPEKTIQSLSLAAMQEIFQINTFGPALVAKYFTPLLCKDKQAILAALSARIGSISDNRLGGWYSYRASKAALNMMLKTLSIELARTHKHAILLGLHPGTVDSALSQPFQKRVPAAKLFTPDYAAASLLSVLAERTPADTGKVYAWDGKEVPA